MSNKVAIVTGASRGIGAATAELLAENGYAVCVNYNSNAEKANRVVDGINKRGGKAIAVQADVSVEQDVIRLFQTTQQVFGTVHALVNNAGINGGAGPVEDMEFDTLHAVFSTNVYSTFLCCREAIKHMKQGGSIVNLTSEAAKFGGNRMTAYAASKAAISTFTIGFAREAGPLNIRVNAVSPGIIDTELHAGATAEKLQALKNSIPVGRMGTTKEVAESIVWLLSDKASYMNGSILSVHGGR